MPLKKIKELLAGYSVNESTWLVQAEGPEFESPEPM